jgi:4-hydroxy-tetrahydrodipicolinate synthase
MLKINDLSGVIPPLVTPVDSNEEPDEAGLRRVVDHCLDGGVHGIFVMGSNGEFYAFDPETQKRAIEITVDQVNGRVPVYAGASAISTKDCIRLARISEKSGADAITVLPPTFINPSEKELYAHFVRIADSTSLPVILYNNPGKTTNNISPDLLKELAAIDNILGVKNTNLDFSQTIQYIDETRENENFRVLSGTDYYIYATLAHGGYGCIAGTANVAPSLVSEIYNRFMQGDHEGSLRAQYKLLPLRRAYNFGSFPVVMKDCLNLMGLDVGPPVKPIDHCETERLDALKTILADLDLI